MENPTAVCTLRPSLSLQIEQLGHQESGNCDVKRASSAMGCSKVTEEKSVSSFLVAKQSRSRKPSSLTGTEDYLRRIDVVVEGSSSDRKAMSFNPFRGHRRICSGNLITSSKSAEKTPGEKGRSSSFRIKSSEKSLGEKGKSLSSRMDQYSVAKIAASLFHSAGKIERSMSMSRLAHRALPEEVISLRQKFQVASDQNRDFSGSEERGSDSSTKDTEDCAAPLILKPSSLHKFDNDSTKAMLKDDGEAENSASADEESPKPIIEEADSGLPCTHSIGAAGSIQSCNPTLMKQSSCSTNLNHHDAGATNTPILVYGSQSTISDTNHQGVLSLATSKASSSLSSLHSSTQSSFHLDPERSLNLRQETDSPEDSTDFQTLLLTTGKVTEAELTEAAVRSSLQREDYLSGPLFISEEPQQDESLESIGEIKGNQVLTSGLKIEEVTDPRRTCNSDVCLNRSVSCEPGAGAERKKKLRKRRRSVSASGIGAMLLKVVRVSDSGPMVTRRLPKVGPAEIISGAEALRAREYVIQKTAQISMGRSPESFRSPNSSLTVCHCESEDAVKSTYSKFINIEIDSAGDRVELKQYSKDVRKGIDGSGNGGACTCETRKHNHHEKIPRLFSDRGIKRAECTCTHEGMTPTLVDGGSCSSDKVSERMNSNLQQHAADEKFENQTKCTNSTSAATSAVNVEDRSGKSRRRTSKGRTSYDFDSSAEAVKTSNSIGGRLGQALSSMDTSMAITRERSRSFVSRLQAAATSGNASVDVYRLGPCSISILANPSFSSSHQDRLWEEQADIYSSGGRGTPGRDDEPAAAAANAFVHSPSPGNPVSLDDHQVPSASGSLRRGQMDATVRAPSFTSFLSSGDRGSRKKGKKRGRPRTPLRSLSAEDVHRMCCGRRSPEGGHFIQQIMLKIRGHSSRSSSPKCPNSRTKKRNTWSSCICFSAN